MTPSSTSKLAAHLATQRGAVDEETGEIVELAPAEASTAVVPAAEAPPPAPDYTRVPAKVVGALPYASTYSRLAHTIAHTELVPKPLRGRPDAVMAAMMMGYELGLGPMQSLNGVQVIDGKAGLSAELMRALVQQSGHVFILAQSDKEATVRCRRTEWPEGEWATFRWTMADATRAGLVRQGSGWVKYPRAMLAARVTSEACRATFADVLAGMSYTPEELEDISLDSSGAAPEPAASTPRPRRGRSAPEEPSGATSQAPAAEADPTAAEAEAAPDAPSVTVTEPEAPAAPEPPVDDDPAVVKDMVKGMGELFRSHPAPVQTLIRAYLAQHGMGNPHAYTLAEANEACRIVAGWPTSVAGEVVDAEVVEGEELF